MKRFSVILLTLILLSCKASCCSKLENEGIGNIYFADFCMDGTKKIEDTLHNEYYLNDLIAFFGLGTHIDPIASANDKKMVRITEADQIFPVEVIREKGHYSVYKVIEGGYFYVFWSTPVDSTVEPSVSFAAYLSGKREISLFKDLVVGVHTAQDVKTVDPSMQLQFLLSGGVFSYSYLDPENLVEIRYDFDAHMTGYDQMVISEITLIKREDAPSEYRFIISDDLPE